MFLDFGLPTLCTLQAPAARSLSFGPESRLVLTFRIQRHPQPHTALKSGKQLALPRHDFVPAFLYYIRIVCLLMHFLAAEGEDVLSPLLFNVIRAH